MKPKPITLFLILVPLFLLGCSQTQPLNLPQPQQQAIIDELYADDIVYDLLENDELPIETITSDAYFKFTNPEKTFSVIFQHYPFEEVDIPTDSVILGGKVVRNSVWAPNHVTYLNVDDPQEYVTRLIKRKEDSIRESYSADIFEEVEITTEPFSEHGYSGQEIVYKFSNTVADVTFTSYGRERFMITEDYIYLLSITPQNSEENVFGEDATKFFGSFQLLEN